MEEFVLPDNYTFNEEQKRLEPTEKKCSFCNKAEMENIRDCYFAPVFMTKDRTYLVVYASVKYAKILIGIPRCKSCRKIHESSKVKATLLAIIVGILIIVLSAMTQIVPFVVVGFFGGIFTAVFGSMYGKDWFASHKGIKTLKGAAEKNGLVQKFLASGWSLKQPEAM
ncbi:hypothetical protein [Flavobacterium wongokense]|uniref:hypothetical protein n=1 Tax=Flavobacterium wongokense TaxID=2910674 RepID=UPI001F1A3454|nr:hypothetical protein [Flavobacterium sp. WG47]MCF6133337.1 hypothetical protein [Flavobacterium sp. WG47]